MARASLAEQLKSAARPVWASPVVPAGVKTRLRRTLRKFIAPSTDAPLAAFDLPASKFVEYAYNVMLRREPDPTGRNLYTGMLARHELDRNGVLDHLRNSEEFRWSQSYVDLLASLHYSRCEFVRSLPRARRILDLGGTHQSDVAGALVSALHYPYPFDEVVIVDLPPDERDEIYRYSEPTSQVVTPQGTVSYRYHSMADLSGLADETFDLVYSGQTIEHVTPDDADLALKEAARVLRPGGYLALDTPNGPVCRLDRPDFINHDHKIEYSEAELSAKLRAAGYEILEVKGLNYLGHAYAEGGIDLTEVAQNWGVFAAAADCYLLAYLCRKPLRCPSDL